ncbi:MAG: alpha/beta fold hydrolase [Phycisphaerales bacterium]|nr:alpha/beta fold hydrolase [Phycisphaerales bacterium]
MSRTVVQFEVMGTTLFGTRHAPQGQADTTACVLLNPGPAPRAGNSDLYVQIADRLAREGVQCIRVDLPGLGDSAGPSYPTIDDYWRQVQAGVNDRTVIAVLAQARERFGAQRVVVGGLCAGAISAVRACARAPDGIAGLMLLEPNFRRSAETGPAAQADESGTVPTGKPSTRWCRVLDVDSWLHLLAGDRAIARPFRWLRPLIHRVLTRRIGHALPRDCNEDLVVCWSRVHALGIPSLVVCAEGQLSHRYIDRILRTIPAGRSQVQCRVLSGTNHILTAGHGRRDAAEEVARWWMQRHGACAPAGAASRGAGATTVSVPA